MKPKPPVKAGRSSRLLDTWLPIALWGVAGAMFVVVALLLGWNPTAAQANDQGFLSNLSSTGDPTGGIQLAAFSPDLAAQAVVRMAEVHTTIPERSSTDVQTYLVQEGDSIFGIAKSFNIEPETVLWANYATLKDNPDMISPGVTLNIPPVNGVYYQVKGNETVKDLALRFNVTEDDILLWPGNHLDMTNPQLADKQYVLAPGGKREFTTWIVPSVWRPKSGVLKNILGPGGCDVNGGAYGGGAFIWPAANHYLSGNDFWSGHQGIDIAAGMGASIYASDTGVVVYAGAIGGGYGNMIMIDHGNGYQTLYAHLSVINVKCGVSVSRGALIGAAGSTGNSTGPHLHFEVRYMGGFINPWKVLG